MLENAIISHERHHAGDIMAVEGLAEGQYDPDPGFNLRHADWTHSSDAFLPARSIAGDRGESIGQDFVDGA
jgi:hypothetical protein